MKKKPILFNLLSFTFLLLALSFPLQVIYMLNLSIYDSFISFNYLSDINLLSMVAFLLLAIGMYFSTRHIANFLILSTIMVSINNYWVSQLGQYSESLMPILSTSIYGILIFIFFKSKYFEVLSQRKLQWWKTPTRYQCNLDFVEGSKQKGKVLNASKSGLLVHFEDNYCDGRKQIDSIIDFNLENSTGVVFSLKAQVVRICPHTGGLGLQLLKSSKLLDQYLTKNCQQLA